MELKQLLIDSRRLIENPDNWTQGVYARNLKGQPCLATANAVCFCSLGAVKRTLYDNNLFGDQAHDLWTQCHNHLTDHALEARGFHHFNDHHTHAEVLAVWDRAIAALPA